MIDTSNNYLNKIDTVYYKDEDYIIIGSYRDNVYH